MEVLYLTRKNYKAFESLLLPKMASALETGKRVIACGAVEKGVAVGALAGVFEEEHFLIDSFYVAPEYRRKGCGKLLLDTLSSLLSEEMIPMEISFTVTQPEHEELVAFLEKEEFERVEDFGQNIFCTELSRIMAHPMFQTLSEKGCVPFAELDKASFYSLELQSKRGDDFFPIPEGGFLSPEVDRELSYVYQKNGKIEAYIIFDRSCLNGPTVTALWSQTPQGVLFVLRAAATKVFQRFSPDTRIAFQTVNEASARFVSKLLPDAESISHRYYKASY